jgi:hypothetical protein
VPTHLVETNLEQGLGSARLQPLIRRAKRRIDVRGMRTLVLTVALVLVTVAPQAHATATPISTCGQTVTTNAVLTQDLVCTGDAIVVGAAGITINLKGYTVRGDGEDFGVRNDAGHSQLTVVNGVVRGFFFGIFSNGAGTVVSNVVAAGNRAVGIEVHGEAATIRSSSAYGNRSQGILVAGPGASITHSTASGNTFGPGGGGGITVQGDSAAIGSSTASGNGDRGILVVGVAASVVSSSASGNGGHGIHVVPGPGKAAEISGNRADGNGFSEALSDHDGLGIAVDTFVDPPLGTNSARGNDDPAECAPASLC